MNDQSREAFFEELKTYRQNHLAGPQTVRDCTLEALEAAGKREDIRGLTSSELRHAAGDVNISTIKEALKRMIEEGIVRYAGTLESRDVSGRKCHSPLYAVKKKDNIPTY